MNYKIFVINGTPGTGKSTIGKLLNEKGYYVIEEKDLYRQLDLLNDYDDEKETYVLDEQIVHRVLNTKLEETLPSTENIVIVGHLTDLIPPRFVKKCIVLTSDLKILQDRLIRRGYKESKVKENIEAEIFKECYLRSIEAFGKDKVIEILNIDIDETINIVLNLINE